MCPTNDGVEDTEHFLLHCPSFDEERRDLLAGDFRYCDHMDISMLQTSFLPTFYCMAIKVFLMTLIEIYYN